ncbi:TetR/AcrR family transcriptional regulator [Cupriavidus lacunae]|uniref:TetR/AcrR family transcriptional regulator n=1 Tax=Cupriavidus lacunae TaxID=2666307 RepID=A0A370P0A6_9BURK|nr:TetR/AcrR family transcriptional regulator [Cupriavidus lacunae]RDK11301.1 TetR/AcrR family transcriptional regulator [Cupriavidus lacunae]
MLTDKQLQVIQAAYGVFFRYGFARTTMGDLAKAAGMSRPALYLVYCGKEEVFQAVVAWMGDNLLETIQSTLKEDWPLERKLMHVLELCIARPYEQVRANPDAQDLLALDSHMPALEQAYGSLQTYLADLLKDAVNESGLKVAAIDVARTLMSAMRGFKLVAVDGKDLRRLIAMQVTLTTAALGQQGA